MANYRSFRIKFDSKMELPFKCESSPDSHQPQIPPWSHTESQLVIPQIQSPPILNHLPQQHDGGYVDVQSQVCSKLDLTVKFEPSQDSPYIHSSESIKQEPGTAAISRFPTEVKVFNCTLCEYTTNDKSNFKRHQQFKHKLTVLEPHSSKDYF